MTTRYDLLSGLGEAEIDGLIAEGITPTPAEIVELSWLGWAVESPQMRRHLARGVPVQVGGVSLWPLTLYAADWYDRVGCQLPGERLQVYALAYAMAHGADGCDHEGIESRRVVRAWARGLRCTMRELEVAVVQVQDQEHKPDVPPTGPDGAEMTTGDFSAHLAAALGGDVEFWERRCSSAYALAALSALAAQNRAEGKSNAHDERMIAERAMGIAVNRIRARHATGEASDV